MKNKKYEFIHDTCVRRSNGMLVLFKLPEYSPKIIGEFVKAIKYSIDWLINYQGDDVVLKWGYRYAVISVIIVCTLSIAVGETFREGTPFILSFLKSLLGIVCIITLFLLLAFTIFMHITIYWTNYAKLATQYIRDSNIDSNKCTIENLKFPTRFKWSSHTVAILLAYTPLILLSFTSPFFRRLVILLFITIGDS